MLDKGNLSVDVPIDLQGLMGLDPPEEQKEGAPWGVWELTLRPVDYAFNALPALADRLGAPAARFRNILATCQRNQLGSRLWETYPGAVLHGTLRLQDACCTEHIAKQNKITYKGQETKYDGAEWKGNGLACIANALNIKPKCPADFDDVPFSDDELDAVLCALTGVAPPLALLSGCQLGEQILCRIQKRLNAKEKNNQEGRPRKKARATAPVGYVLLRCKFWSEIHLERMAWNAHENPR